MKYPDSHTLNPSHLHCEGPALLFQPLAALEYLLHGPRDHPRLIGGAQHLQEEGSEGLSACVGDKLAYKGIKLSPNLP